MCKFFTAHAADRAIGVFADIVAAIQQQGGMSDATIVT
jgi:hypothetical protein